MVMEPASKAHAPPPRRLSSGAGRGQELLVPGPYGRFRLVERLGTGGMAEVYRAHEGTDAEARSLVIKRLKREHLTSTSALRLFTEEARLAASINHPNIVRVFGLESLPHGDVFMTMEHVDGADLRWLLNMARRRGRRLPIWMSLHIVSEVLAALDYLSKLRGPADVERNVVHCDVTPENVFISSDGQVKLGDFGVAVEDARPEDFHLGQLRGKLPYCSPEQARGERLDARSDLYSAATVLWECLAGRPLVSTRDQDAAKRAILSDERPRPSSLNPEVPQGLDDLVLAALAPERTRRTPSAKVLRDRLQRLLHALRPPVSREHVVEGMTQVLAPPPRGSSGAHEPASRSTEAPLLVASPPPVQVRDSQPELPAAAVPFPTYVHYEGRSFGPVALCDALARMEERAHLDMDTWGLSVSGAHVVEAQDVLRILGSDMQAAEREGAVAFEVTLAEQSLASLFGQLTHTRSSGTLIVVHEDERGRDERHLRLAEGRLVDVWSAISTLRLWSALARAPHTHHEQFAGGLHRALAERRVVFGRLPDDVQDDLREARLFELQRQLEEMFTWSDGVARFLPSQMHPVEDSPALAHMVPELVLQTHDEARLMPLLEPHLTDKVIAGPGLEAELPALKLLDAERDVVVAALEAATLAEALLSVPDEGRAMAASTIYALQAIGLLRYV